jgi:hypothetical protein
MPGTAKMIGCRAPQPGPEPALRAEEQHEDQAGDDRRDGEGQVDQRDQQALAAELELGDRPGRATPKTRLSGTAIAAVSSVSRIADARRLAKRGQ